MSWPEPSRHDTKMPPPRGRWRSVAAVLSPGRRGGDPETEYVEEPPRAPFGSCRDGVLIDRRISRHLNTHEERAHLLDDRVEGLGWHVFQIEIRQRRGDVGVRDVFVAPCTNGLSKSVNLCKR